jgi:hypothetical protein
MSMATAFKSATDVTMIQPQYGEQLAEVISQ